MVLAVCLLLLLPSMSFALVDAPSPWLRALCATEMEKLSCAELFGEAQEFALCEETNDTCSFNVRLDQSNCHQLCNSLGSTCVRALNNMNSACEAVPDSMDTCMTRRNTEICVCQRRNDVATNRMSCTDAFGAAPGFELCNERDDQCAFVASTDRSNCTDMCARFNAKCLGAQDNSTGCQVLPNSMDTCDTNRLTEICTCERPFQ